MCYCRVWSPEEPVMWQPERSWKSAGEKTSKGHFLFSEQQLEPYSLLCDKSHETIYSHKKALMFGGTLPALFSIVVGFLIMLSAEGNGFISDNRKHL